MALLTEPWCNVGRFRFSSRERKESVHLLKCPRGGINTTVRCEPVPQLDVSLLTFKATMSSILGVPRAYTRGRWHNTRREGTRLGRKHARKRGADGGTTEIGAQGSARVCRGSLEGWVTVTVTFMGLYPPLHPCGANDVKHSDRRMLTRLGVHRVRQCHRGSYRRPEGTLI